MVADLYNVERLICSQINAVSDACQTSLQPKCFLGFGAVLSLIASHNRINFD